VRVWIGWDGSVVITDGKNRVGLTAWGISVTEYSDVLGGNVLRGINLDPGFGIEYIYYDQKLRVSPNTAGFKISQTGWRVENSNNYISGSLQVREDGTVYIKQ